MTTEGHATVATDIPYSTTASDNSTSRPAVTAAKPAPTTVSLLTLYDMLENMNRNMTTRFDGIDRQLQKVNEDISEIKKDVSDLDTNLQSLDTDIVEIKEETIPALKAELQAEIAELRKTQLETEMYSKRSNLLFFNISSQGAVKNEDTELALRSILDNIMDQSKIIIANCHRLPSKGGNKGPVPIIAKFVQMKDRNAVLEAVTRTNFKLDAGRTLIAVPHLPAEILEKRKRLMPKRNELKAQGKNA